MSVSESIGRARDLLAQQRWAALATVGDNGQPECSMVAYAMSTDFTRAYLHLSELAAHTRNLMHEGRASLAITESDCTGGDPQQLARISLSGHISRLAPSEPDYQEARNRYLKRLPDAAPLFDFGDFHLFSLQIDTARFVAGFGQARTLSGKALSRR